MSFSELGSCFVIDVFRKRVANLMPAVEYVIEKKVYDRLG